MGRHFPPNKHANMFPNDLTTNEVKNSAGTEEEFLRQSLEGRELVFAKSGEVPSAPHRLSVKHTEIGTGASARRRSLVRVDKTIAGTSGTSRTVSAYAVVDIPVGDIADYDDSKDALANLMSVLTSLGASTTILFDCSGYGASALINGTL